mgnify:CR=1 FL=1
MLAVSSVAVVFAAISIVGAGTLALLVSTQQRKINSAHGMTAFHRHLDALSDDSREHVRSQLRDAKQRQVKR